MTAPSQLRIRYVTFKLTTCTKLPVLTYCRHATRAEIRVISPVTARTARHAAAALAAVLELLEVEAPARSATSAARSATSRVTARLVATEVATAVEATVEVEGINVAATEVVEAATAVEDRRATLAADMVT